MIFSLVPELYLPAGSVSYSNASVPVNPAAGWMSIAINSRHSKFGSNRSGQGADQRPGGADFDPRDHLLVSDVMNIQRLLFPPASRGAPESMQAANVSKLFSRNYTARRTRIQTKS